jgi:hypothetical protein
MIKIDENQLNRFLKEEGYFDATMRNYSEYIRLVNREGLREDAIDQTYKNYSPETKGKLRTAVRLLDEFKDWCKNDSD